MSLDEIIAQLGRIEDALHARPCQRSKLSSGVYSPLARCLQKGYPKSKRDEEKMCECRGYVLVQRAREALSEALAAEC